MVDNNYGTNLTRGITTLAHYNSKTMSRRPNSTRRLADSGGIPFMGSLHSKSCPSPLLSVGLLAVGALLIVGYMYHGSGSRNGDIAALSRLDDKFSRYKGKHSQFWVCVGVFFRCILLLRPLFSIHSGHKKLCLLFYMLHLFVGIWKRITVDPAIWLLGQRQDTLNDMFWLMTFAESASFIFHRQPVIAITYVTRGWKEAPQAASFKDYRILFYRNVISDKRIWLLSWVQVCVHFSVAAFWILWTPTIVADGRNVSLGLIYPCFMGARMLGSTGFPWLFNGPLSIRMEECLVYLLIVMGLVFSIVAYDYQLEILFYKSEVVSFKDNAIVR
ncbi:Major facilitator superfamily protein [Forsythia ovata]|uniref:Major facilitator superfamily protein n=1 Tax=Forsythia ovata TaxID=205694 RepID=A0ABD1S1B4_9LAMI